MESRTLDMNNKTAQAYTFKIDNELKEELKYVSKTQGVSLYDILLAAFKVMLFRRSGQYDLCVATPNATFSDILALRTSINADETFEALLQRVKETTRYAYAHTEISFEETAKLVSSKNNTQNSLYQFMFVLQNFAEEELNRDRFDETISRFGL